MCPPGYGQGDVPCMFKMSTGIRPNVLQDEHRVYTLCALGCAQDAPLCSKISTQRCTLHAIRWIQGKSVYREIFTLILLSPFCPPCLQANKHVELGEFQCLKLSIFKHKCIRVNSRWSETVCKCRRTKITQGKNKPVLALEWVLGYVTGVLQEDHKKMYPMCTGWLLQGKVSDLEFKNLQGKNWSVVKSMSLLLKWMSNEFL